MEENEESIQILYWERLSVSVYEGDKLQQEFCFSRQEITKEKRLQIGEALVFSVDTIEDEQLTLHSEYTDHFTVDVSESVDVEGEDVRIVFDLIVDNVHLKEWASIEDEYFEYIIPLDMWAAMWNDEDAEVAYQVCCLMEEQHPEQLEIIAEYMAFADDFGSKDAHAWLMDYYEVPDSRWDPYV